MSRMTKMGVALAITLVVVLLLGACTSPSPTTTAPTTTAPTTTAPTTTAPTTTAPTATQAKSPFTPYPGKMPDVFTFGTLQAMTGFGAFWGQMEMMGQYLAIDEINASGEFPFKLNVVVGDHASDDPVKGLAAARKMIEVDKVPWINSSWVATTLAVQPIAAENEVVEMNAGGVGVQMIGLPWLHHTRLDSGQNCPPILDYANENFSVKKFAHVWWNDPSGVGMAAVQKEKAKLLGWEEVLGEGYQTGQTDFRSLVAKVKAANPDYIGTWSWGADTGYFIKQAREAGITAPIGGIDLNPELMKVAGNYVEGYFFGGDLYIPEIDTPWAKQFTQAWVTKFGGTPDDIDMYGAFYYELTYVLRDTIRYVLKQGGNPFDGRQLEIALGKVRFFQTLASEKPMELLPNGMCYKPALIVKVENGKRVIDKVIDRPEPLGTYPAGQWITE